MKNQSPFLDIKSFEMEDASQEFQESFSGPSVSPFLAVYESEYSGELIDPETEDYIVFLNELYDEEFNETLANLVNEATSIFEANFSQEMSDPQSIGYQAEKLLNQHFAPLVAEAEAMLESLASEFSQRDPYSLSEAEINEIIDRYQVSETFSPEFDQLFGFIKKIAKKAAGIVKKGVKFASKLGLGPILRKIKPLIKPLLKRVIDMAIGKLPAYLQPIARKLAARAPFLKELEDNFEIVPGNSALSEIAQIQQEFNQQVASLLFASTEVEQDLEIAQALTVGQITETYPLTELNRARDQFVEKMSNLKEDEDPTPYVENFIPAILPALRIGIKLIGRGKVVNFLAKFLAKLIRKFVGPRYARPLSKAIVDVGLRLLNLEATDEEASQASGSQVASLVEETVRRVAEAPEYILDDQELLEAYTLEAFEQAAAAYLPPMLSEETYRERPDLGEVKKLGGIWTSLPIGHGKRCKYRKFSRVLQRRLSPAKVAELETYEGASLGEVLEEQFGMAPGEEFEAQIHLYEATPETRWQSDITRQEALISTVSSGINYQALHPLTREAAGLLLGEPDVGREIDAQQALNPYSISPGQRLYYLEIPGRRRLTVPVSPGITKLRRLTRVRTILDFPKNEIRLFMFLSEVRSQKFAVKLRQRSHIGQVVTSLRRTLKRGLRTALTKGVYGRLKIIHEAVSPGHYRAALQRIPLMIHQILINRVTEWTIASLMDHLKQRSDDFIKAAEDTADGVTILITLSNPPGFPKLREALKGKGASLTSLQLQSGSPAVKIQVFPGYHHE